MSVVEEETRCFQSWTWKTDGCVFICFLILSCITGLFSFLFDVLLFENKFGYVYAYFAVIFYTITLYFFYTKFKANWFGLFSFGLSGIIGIPIELWLEYYRNPVLKRAWAVVAWGGI
ncbi:MAG: hypothetical protein HZR80_19175 [Candidatus Heimdallarchaeota archaeon]